MTIIQLQYVLSVAESRNFTLAAEKSFVTQPTLSMQIQKLERELDIEIFDRSTHPITITPIGQKVIEQAKRIIAESKKMHQMVLEAKGSMEGEVTLGIIPTIFPSLVPLFYKTFKKKYPKSILKIKELKTEEIIEKLYDGSLDFGIAATPLNYDNIIEKPIYYEPLLAFIPSHHPLSNSTTISSNDLDPNDILLLEEGHCFRNNVLSLCDTHEIAHVEQELQSGDFSTLIKLSKEGFGITVLPLLFTEDMNESDKKFLKKFTGTQPTREVSLIYHDSQIRVQFAKEFFNLIQGLIRGKLFLESDNVTSPKIVLS